MSHAKIRAGIEKRLSTWAAAESPPLQIAWQNNDFTPPAGPHLRAFLLPADTTSPFLEGGAKTYVGVYQISVVTPESSGPGAGEVIVGKLETLFPANLRISESGVTIVTNSPVSASPAIQEPGHYVIPCRFRYRVDSTS